MTFLKRFWSTDRSLTVLLVSLSIIIFVIQPLGNLGVVGRVLVNLFFSLLLISGVGAAAESRLATISVGGLVIFGLSVRWLRFLVEGHTLLMLDALLSALLCAILAGVVLVQVFREGPITSLRIQGAIAVYLLFGLGCAFAYAFVDLYWPGAFVPAPATAAAASGDLSLRFVYFSFVTLTTVGYGDIAAVHPVARSLAMVEALGGQLFPSVLLARLVSMELYSRQAEASRRP
jgi:hypothetical protein